MKTTSILSEVKEAKTVNALLEKKQSQPTQANCTYVKNGSLYSIYDGRKIGKLSK